MIQNFLYEDEEYNDEFDQEVILNSLNSKFT